MMLDDGVTLDAWARDNSAVAQFYDNLIQDLSTNQTFKLLRDILKPQLDNLASRTELQGALCNVSALTEILSDANMAGLVSTAVCGQTADWFKLLLDNGVPMSSLQDILNKLYVYLYATLGETERPARANVNFEDLASNVDKFIKMLTGQGIPEGFIPGTNVTYLEQLFSQFGSALEKGAFDIASGVMTLIDGVIGGDEVWKAIKDNLHQQSVYMKFVNSYLNKLEVEGGLVNISSIIPDDTSLVKLLNSILSAEGAAQMLAAGVQPDQFIQLLNHKNWQAIVCDKGRFDQTFVFPLGTDADKELIRVGLCDSATSNSSTIISDIVKLFNFDELLMQTIAGTAPSDPDRVIPDYFKQLKQFWANIDVLLSITGVTSTNLADTWAKLYNFAAGLGELESDNFVGMCDIILPLAQSETWYKTYIKPYLSQVILATEIANQQLELLPEIERLFCDIETLNLTGFYYRLEDMGLLETINKIVNETINSTVIPEDKTCSRIMRLQYDLMVVTNRTQYELEGFGDRVGKCVLSTTLANLTIVRDLDELLFLANEINGLMSNEAIQNLFRMDLLSLAPTINSLLEGLLQQRQVWLKLEDVLKGDANLEQTLLDVASLSPDLISAILKSTINLDLLSIINNTADDLKAILCNSSKLEEYVRLPPGLQSDVTSEAFNNAFCKSNNATLVNDLTQAIDVGRLAFQWAIANREGFLDPNWLKNLTTELSMAFNWFRSVPQLQNFIDDLTSGRLEDVLPEFQKFLLQNDPSVFYSSVEMVLQLLSEGTSSSDPTASKVFHDLKVIANAARALQTVQTYMPVTVRMEDLLKSRDAVRDYLMNTLGISRNTTEALLTASVSYAELMNTTGDTFTDTFCKPDQLGQLFIFDDAAVNVTDISGQLCALNQTQMSGLLDFVLQEANIGTMLQQMLTLSPDKILAKANLTQQEVTNLVTNLTESLSEVRTDLNSLVSSFKNLSQVADISNIASISAGQIGFSDSESLKSMSQMLCGTEDALAFTDDFGLSGDFGINDQRAIKTENGEAVADISQFSEKQKKELASFSSQYCKDMFINIQTSDIGSIIWTYIKPLIRGKIPFSPNNKLTRAIMNEANHTFTEIVQLQEFAYSILNGTDGLYQLVNSSDSLKKLQASNSPIIDSVVSGMPDTGDLMASLDSFTGYTTEDVDTMVTLAQLMLDVTECIELDRFEGFDTEEEMEKRAQELNSDKSMLASVVFLNVDDDATGRRRRQADTTGDGIPKHIQYKIRMDIENVHVTNRLRDLQYVPGPKDDFATDMRYMRGFVQLQDMIDTAIINIHTGRNNSAPVVNLQQFPYPCYEDDFFLSISGTYLLPLMLCLSWLIIVGSAVRQIVYDKELGFEETMKVMGLNTGINWFSWFASTYIWMLILSAIIVLILHFGNILRHSDPFIIFLMMADFSLATLMLAYLVSVFFHRTNIAALTAIIVYLISYLPFVVMSTLSLHLEFWARTLACLCATSALSFGGKIISHLELEGRGLQWDTMYIDYGNPGFNVSWTLIMMLIDAAIYGFLGWYIRNVFPGKYGMPQPWYFPFSPRYWGCCLGTSGSSRGNRYKTNMFKNYGFDGDGEKDPSNWMNEREPQDLPIGIELIELRKKFKKNVAVNKLSARFYEGQITAVLGHNGAGKTTTINMLTGIFPPSSGSANIYGRDIRTDFGKIRQSLGVCPQHDVLFDYMSVEEHLKFYATLKSGKPWYKVHQEVLDMIEAMGLEEMKSVKAKHLSGGMRRRLSVGIAFIGGSKTVILDEPTSGVDPAARRSIWDLIVKNREGRTILISTHHLDEADILGDRVAIIHQGQLVCIGSPMFLKAQFGSGYHLSLSKAGSNECNSDEVLEFIKQYVNEAFLQEEVGTELTYILPVDKGQTVSFERFFTALSKRAEGLRIASYGVSDTTLEEVFLKVTKCSEYGIPLDVEKIRQWHPKELDERMTEGGSIHSSQGSSSGASGSKRDITSRPSSVSGATSASNTQLTTTGRLGSDKKKISKTQQISALFYKRALHTLRDWKTYISMILLPICFMAMAVGFSLIKPIPTNQPSLIMTPSIMKDTNFFMRHDNPTDFNKDLLNTLMSDPGLGTVCMDNMGELHDEYCVEREMKWEREEGYLPDCFCQDATYICSASDQQAHPMYTSLNTSTTVYDLDGYNVNEYLLKTQKDFIIRKYLDMRSSSSNLSESRYGGLTFGNPLSDAVSDQTSTVWFSNEAFHALPAYFNGMSNAILRGMVGQMNTNDASEYGITTFNHPLSLTEEQLSADSLLSKAADTGISLTIICAFSFVPAGFVIYLVTERVRQEKHLQFINGVGPFMYWTVAIVWDMTIFLIPVGLAVIIMLIFNINTYVANLNLAAHAVLLYLFGWGTIPLMYLLSRAFKDNTTAYMALFCLNMFIGILTALCVFMLSMFQGRDPMIKAAYEVMQYVLLIFPQYCLGAGLVDLTKNQLIADIFIRFDTDRYVNPFSFDMIGWHLVALGIEGLVFFIINLLIEVRSSCCMPSGRGMSAKPNHKEDDDVGLERQRVVTGDTNDDVLIMKNLSKTYKNGFNRIHAVNKLCFSVRRGECFGLLGVNGAGKTTTFKMVTGATSPTSGDTYLQGVKTTNNMDNLNNEIGYCPQFDACDPLLTGKEMLNYVAALVGIPDKERKQIVESAINRLSLRKYQNIVVKNYSGGTKRKLSVAMALIGEPAAILLDEPTTGMDPGTKRLVWNNILKAVKSGRSVMLTSHSMAECDALCTRVAIMVNGQFVCMGSPQHLKNKFGEGYTVTLRVENKALDDIHRTIEDFKRLFPGAQLKDHHYTMLQFNVPVSSNSLAQLFGTLEEEKNNIGVEDYSVSQTSLEQVFVNFAKRQGDGTQDDDLEGIEIELDPPGHPQGFINNTYNRDVVLPEENPEKADPLYAEVRKERVNRTASDPIDDSQFEPVVTVDNTIGGASPRSISPSVTTGGPSTSAAGSVDPDYDNVTINSTNTGGQKERAVENYYDNAPEKTTNQRSPSPPYPENWPKKDRPEHTTVINL
ncbi:unnamed protein product [Owenia fusiformis]|uniref:ABC transporter domain-containing protein n=1 Tax=Owenia fusiformis TaxID=6347 RepID=A0A8S4PN28_OWEFU|nr:unnamed protein product [Owenia fusiformis]